MATLDKTPYQILGIPETIDYVELRIVYRTKILEHKQKKISPSNFRYICRAYETLSDFEKRKRYDTRKEWISELPLNRYTPQQLAAEPELIRELKQNIFSATLTKINAQDPVTGHTTLYCAARAGNVEAVKFLTEHGAEPDLMQRTKSTALHVAAFYGHADIVWYLLESGADYRILNSVNNTPEKEAFNDAVKQVFAELKQIAYVRAAANELEWFLKNGLTQHQDTEYFAQRQTLLHCASKKGYFDMVRWLVEQGKANVDILDINGNSALHLAAYGGHTDIVNYLLNCGCDSTVENRWGTTAEEEGSKHGNSVTSIFQDTRGRDMFEMARDGVDWWFYYHFGNKSTSEIDPSGTSLLYYACRYGRHSVAKWLLQYGANPDIQMKVAPKSTPLHVAKYRGHLSIVELLLEYGADVNIKNDYGATVFEEVILKEVNKDVSDKIKDLLLKHQHNLKSEKILDIHVYDDDGDGQKPIAKIKLGLEAKKRDLLAALLDISDNQDAYFSIARRALDFKKEDTTIISALCRARYTSSKFIETPICLIRHKTEPKICESHKSTRQEPKLDLAYFHKQFTEQGTENWFSLKATSTEKQNINVGSLMFTFPERCINGEIRLKVTAVFPSNVQMVGLPGCICLFKIELGRHMPNLVELPVVSINNEPYARLYTLATPAPYWFASDTRRNHLPMVSGIHAFVRHVNIVPNQLTLPPDTFIAAALGKPLKRRSNPVPCTRLLLRERDKSTFPHIAYHGTNINAIRSILLDGLVAPGTVVSNGIRVSPPSNHFSRENTYFDVSNFADAIFLTPSIHYSSDSTYATKFSDGDRQVIPVLECSVKSGSYETYAKTVERYIEHPGDDLKSIEWRVTDGANVEINAVLFITEIDSIIASKKARMNAITASSDGCILI
jgi:ankyrin repeat protein